MAVPPWVEGLLGTPEGGWRGQQGKWRGFAGPIAGTIPSEIKQQIQGRGGDATDAKEKLGGEAGLASDFANRGQQGYSQLGAEAAARRQFLMDLASGKHSIAGEQLRQGAQQNIAGQRSMAAGARPQNAAMAARNAMNNAGRIGTALSGQQALAGLQERQMAEQALSNMILQQRGQDLQAALGSRGNAINAYGNIIGQPKEASGLEKAADVAKNIAALFAMSDKRLKTDIKDGDGEAKTALEKLHAYRFKYKDPKHGEGEQLGVMAQDLRRAGLGHAVIETDEGLAVDGAKLATSNTAMLATLAKRVSELEGSKPSEQAKKRGDVDNLMRLAKRKAQSRH